MQGSKIPPPESKILSTMGNDARVASMKAKVASAKGKVSNNAIVKSSSAGTEAIVHKVPLSEKTGGGLRNIAGEDVQTNITKHFAKDSIMHGECTAQEALNGSKALMDATGMKDNLKNAKESAEAMKESGLLDELARKEKQQELKASLLKKHGEKLEQKRLKEAQAEKIKAEYEQKFTELDKLDQLLQK